jgi:uncharacterized protein YjbI with pentapeptide repeats
MILEIIIGLAVVVIIVVSYVTYAKVWGFEKTLEAQKREFVSEEIKAGRFDNSRLAKFHDNVGVIGNLAIGSNIGIYGDLAVARNAGVTGSLAVGDYINAQGVRSSNVFTRNVFAETSSIGEARIDSGNFRYARLNDAGFIGASFSNAAFSNAGFTDASFTDASFSNAMFQKSDTRIASITNARINSASVESASFSKFAKFNDRADFANSICMTDNGQNVCIVSDDVSKMKRLFGTLNTLTSDDVNSVKNVTRELPFDTIKKIKDTLNAFNPTQASFLQNLASTLQGIDLTNMRNIISKLNSTDINRIKDALQKVDENKVGGLTADQVNKLRLFSDILNGTGQPANQNIVSAAGTLGPTMLLHWGFQDVNVGGIMNFSKEPGNPANGWGDPANGVYSVFHWGFLATNNSGERMSWNRARLIIRAVNLGDGGGYAKVRIQQWNYQATRPNPNPIGGYRDLTSQFDIVCPQIWRGYMTNVSPWFSLYTNDVPGLVLRLDSCPNNNTMRFGSVHIQFAA